MSGNLTTQVSAIASVPNLSVIATDLVSGANFQRMKISQGDTGTATDVSSGAPLWVSLASSALSVAMTSGSVAPSSQWTVTTMPSSTIAVVTTPSTQTTVTVQQSTTLSVAPSTTWNVTTTPSSVANVTTTPSSVVNVTTTPSSQVTVTTVPSSVASVTLTSGTQVIGSVAPSTQWTVTTTPSSVTSVNLTSSVLVIGSVAPSTQWTVVTIPSSQTTVALSTSGNQVNQAWNVVFNNVGQTPYTPVFVNTTLATSGSTALATLMASATGFTGVLMNLMVNATVASNVSIVGVTASVATTLMRANMAANSYFILPYADKGWCQTASGSGLGVVLSSAVATAINISAQYIQSS